jgi:hypothetical protein
MTLPRELRIKREVLIEFLGNQPCNTSLQNTNPDPCEAGEPPDAQQSLLHMNYCCVHISNDMELVEKRSDFLSYSMHHTCDIIQVAQLVLNWPF